LTVPSARAYNTPVSSNSEAITMRSYAKVNLTLDVLGKRPDGFHAIESVMQTISLHDTVTLRVGDRQGIRVTCDMPGIPTGEANLAYKAALLFFESRGIAPGMDIQIEKRIPPQAGLGGGSSNAAAVLRALSRMLEREGELMGLAAQIGSDVPFFLVGGTAFVSSRGEEVQPLPDIRTWWLAIVKPPFGVSTTWAYQRLDEMRKAVCERESHSRRILRYIEAASPLPDLLWNDLELPVIERYPGIGEAKESLLRVGARGALMCGSGSAVFGLFDSEDEAHKAVGQLGQNLGELFLAKTISREEAIGLPPSPAVGCQGHG